MLTDLKPLSPLKRYLILEGEEDGGAGGGSGGGGDEPKHTDADVDRLKAQARAEGRRSAAKELAEQLGCTVEEAKSRIAAATEAEAGKKTEAERMQAEAVAAKAEAEAEKQAAQRERFEAKVERKLLTAGIDDKALARATRLIDLASDADDDEIAAEIEALKTEVPGLFAASEEGGKAPAPAPGVKGAKAPATKGLGGKSIEEFGRENAKRLGIKIAS